MVVIAAVSVVLPWSTCPIVPTFTCGFVRSNLALAMVASFQCSFGCLVRRRGPFLRPFRLLPSSRAGLNRGPHPYQGCALPTELRERSYPLTPAASCGLQAGDGTRTRDPQLGRLMLYQLSYTRV